MNESTPIVRFAVSCPVCRREVTVEYRAADVAGALLNHRPIRLHTPCHDASWTAGYVETQQIRAHLEAVQLGSPREARSAASEDGTED
ncbi:MAG TPA: hypothetical protein VME42_17265 [Steroidobacteraceae bacterium]|nr:hypothetical protein [Steroidobacteraceae bacterium]